MANLDAGDTKYHRGQTVTFDTGGNTVEGGDAVTFDGSGNVTRAVETDFLLGSVLPTTHGDDYDNKVSVNVGGLCVVVEVPAGASVGDHVQGNSAGDGTYQTVATPGEDTSWPLVIEEEDADNNLYVALFR